MSHSIDHSSATLARDNNIETSAGRTLGMGAGDVTGHKAHQHGSSREPHRHGNDCTGADNEDHGVYGAPMGRPIGDDYLAGGRTTTTVTTGAVPVLPASHEQPSHHQHQQPQHVERAPAPAPAPAPASHSHDHSDHTGGAGTHVFGRSGAGEGYAKPSERTTEPPREEKGGIFNKFDMTKDHTSTAETDKYPLGKHDVAPSDGVNRPDVDAATSSSLPHTDHTPGKVGSHAGASPAQAGEPLSRAHKSHDLHANPADRTAATHYGAGGGETGEHKQSIVDKIKDKITGHH